jgi:glycosyltransferase involved in cell wall biosynthesis
MKILVIHNRYKNPGGEDVVVRHEYELLQRNGQVLDRMFFDNSSIRSSYEQLLTGVLAFYNPISARKVREKIRAFQPDIIHVHNFSPLVSPSVFFVASEWRIPVVLTLHNFRLLCPSGTLFHNNAIYERSIHSLFPWEAVRKGVYRNSSFQTAVVAGVTAAHNIFGTWRNKVQRYIVLSAFAKDKFVNSRLRIPVEKLVVKPNFVENRGRGDKTRQDFFLYVGRLSEEKGLRTLLNSSMSSGFNLVIIGDGPLRTMVEQETSTNHRLRYLGFQDPETVASYLKTSRALILPSVCYEGFPMVILEAFSTGTLVVASRLGAMAEIIQDHVNGLLFEPGNPADLAAKIREVHEHPGQSMELARTGYATYLESYTPERNYQQLMEIYHQAIAELGNRDSWKEG